MVRPLTMNDRRDELRQPIRLRVTFKTVRALVNEYTTSVSKGGCVIRAEKALEPGTVFLFELSTEGHARKTVEIEGRVVHATPRKGGGFDIGISYVSTSTPRRIAMTRFLDQVFAEQLSNRNHARMPVNLIAEDQSDPSVRYLLRDLSRGGVGLRLAVERPLPSDLTPGQRVQIIVHHDGDVPFYLEALIARLDAGDPPKRQPAIGLSFDQLGEANQRVVEALLYLHRPKRLQVKFFKPG